MIEFKNPPTAGKSRGRGAETDLIIAALKSRPGEWALIKTDVTASSATPWKKREGIEARSSSVGKPEGKADIYARWVGTP